MKPKKRKPRKNSNYQTGFTSVVKHFAEYEYLRKQPAYTMLLNTEAQSETVGRFIRHVFVQLKENTGKRFPDYYSFNESMSGYLSNEKHTTAMHYKGFTNGAMQGEPTNGHAIYAIAAVYHGAIKSLEADVEKEPDEQGRLALAGKYWEIWNRWKLLNSMFDDLEKLDRLIDGLESVNEEISLSEDSLLEFGDDTPSPQNLMIRLGYALSKDLKYAANRLVGMLQMVKDKLDPGEYAYFSAMVYMKESDSASLDKAYKELKKIPETAVEYGTSRGMLAEVLARKGNPESFLEVFDYHEHIGQLAMFSYVQQLILSMPFQSVSEENVEQVQQSEMIQKLGLVTDRLFECYSDALRVSTEEPEYFAYLNNILEAAKQVYHFNRELPYVTPDDLKNAVCPGIVSKAVTLLEATGTLYKEALEQLMDDNTQENRARFITQYFNFPKKGSVTAISPRLDLMLRAARVFLTDEEFVDTFLQNYNTYETVFSSELQQQWLTEAYFTALSCEHSRHAELRERLDKMCPDQGTAFEEDATYRSVWGMLTGPGKLLYASAESSYRAARDSDYGWKDAGMLSLGYFRLVEVELRQRLLVDVFGKKDPDVRQWLREVGERSQQETEDNSYDVVKIGKGQFSLSRTLIVLKQPEKLSMEQMEYCFHLLSERAEIAPEWETHRDTLRRKFYSALSAEGIQASKDGRIAKTICVEKRTYYRNPPAHARYLSIEKAGECRDYVNQVISTLCGSWLA